MLSPPAAAEEGCSTGAGGVGTGFGFVGVTEVCPICCLLLNVELVIFDDLIGGLFLLPTGLGAGLVAKLLFGTDGVVDIAVALLGDS